MKNFLKISLMCAFMLLVSLPLSAQKLPGLDASPLDMSFFRTARNAPPIARVIYSRPQLKGRELSTLAPSGKVWRLGANESTELGVFQEVNIGGTTLEPGRYTLYAIPGDKEWTLIINSGLNSWGAYSYKDSQDVARVKGSVSSADDTVEAFTMTFSSDALILAWGNTRVSVPLAVK